MQEKDKIIATVLRFVNEIFAGTVDCIILTGSIVDGNYTMDSDVDVLCITSRFDYIRVESFKREGLLLQIILLPVNAVQDLLWREYTTRDIVYISMLKKGLILQDKEDYASRLQHIATTIYNAGPPPLQYEELSRRINHLSSLISDLQFPKDFSSYYLVFMEATAGLTDLFLRLNNEWFTHSKFMMRILQEKHAVFYRKLIAAIKSYFNADGVEPFVRLATATLQLTGGPTTERNSYNLHFIPKGPLYFIQVAGVENYILESKQIYAVLEEWMKISPTRYCRCFLFRRQPIGDTNLEYESIFIALDTSISTEEINVLIQALSSDELNNWQISHPINYDLLHFFADKQILDKAIALFQFSFVNCTLALKDETGAIAHVFYLLDQFGSVFKEHNIACYPFLHYAAALFRSMAMDNGRIANLEQLLAAEKSIETNINNFIEAQKHHFIDILQSVSGATRTFSSLEQLIRELFQAIWKFQHETKMNEGSVLLPFSEDCPYPLLYNLIAQVIQKTFEVLMIQPQQYYFLFLAYSKVLKESSNNLTTNLK
jgi:predicted nucleotidyltransferase